MIKNLELGSFIIRLVLGIIFLVHGFTKFQGGIENTAGFFSSIGLPGFLAYLVGGVELIGGILLILGLGTRIIAGAFAAIMVGAIFTVKLKSGFVGGYEFELALLAMSLHLLFSGNQFFAMDNVFVRRKSESQST
ncbi:DoxX family protein [Geobacillus sp. 44B]|jgi:putative oxidoreductase|uniref:DoxX family protein n=1 Tax=Saccharococcus caldoxylosilyticus TaxID=81408 RepID=UPI00036F3758|nr:DoxX family protein [Parageobacillus caldoxylosilyticus]QNU37546.1 DoxX family protein [Geobacillus sp. 44B]QXJ37133.1 Putative oxidoreductase CatD [Parageobacillus caldoxylosilyticus]